MAYAGSRIFYTECSWISQEEQWKSCAKQNDVPRPGSGCLLVAWRCRPAWYGEAHGERLRVGNACACGWMRCGRGFFVCAWSRRWCSGVRAQALSGSDPSRVTSTWVGVTRRPGGRVCVMYPPMWISHYFDISNTVREGSPGPLSRF